MEAETAQIGALGPVNGMNEPHKDGSYIRIAVRPAHGAAKDYLISRGGAEVLIAELRGVLQRGEK